MEPMAMGPCQRANPRFHLYEILYNLLDFQEPEADSGHKLISLCKQKAATTGNRDDRL